MPALLPSELPIRASIHNHWITMLTPPHKVLTIALAILLLGAIADPNPMAWIFALVIFGIGFLRWQTWRAESVVITGKRIVRYDGVPETTSFEASLRLDRISGAVLVKTVPGKILGYGTIELEAPGDHPDIRMLRKMAGADEFYLQLRRMIFGSSAPTPDPDDEPTEPTEHTEHTEHTGHSEDYLTEELPAIPPAGSDPPLPDRRDRYGRLLP